MPKLSRVLALFGLLAGISAASAHTFFVIKPLGSGEIPIDSSRSIELDQHYGVYDAENPRVRIATSRGDIHLDLRPDQAPATVDNFLQYVTSGAYTDSIFHRSVPDFVIQTGGFRILYNDQGPYFDSVETLPPVQNEPNVSNTRGTIAMAKLGGDPDSATSQWFVNLGDNGANLDNQNGGFTVFGQVDEAGMEVVDAIAGLPFYNLAEYLGIPAFTDVPLYGVQEGQTDVFLSNIIMVHSAGLVPLDPDTVPAPDRPGYAIASNSAPELLEATLDGSRLMLTPTGAGTGEVEITLEVNHPGGSLSPTLSITIGDPFLPQLLPSAQHIGSGWWLSDWLGYLYAGFAPWIYHPNLDWLYLATHSDEAFWAWSPHPELGWLWTSAEVFPWFYRASTEGYLYLDDSPGSTLRFHFPGQGWQQLP